MKPTGAVTTAGPKGACHLPGTVAALKRLPFAIDTLGMSVAPHEKRLGKGVGRHDVFPFEALGALRLVLDLVTTACQVDLFTGVSAATVEGGGVVGEDLSGKLLGFRERLNGGVTAGMDQGDTTEKQAKSCVKHKTGPPLEDDVTDSRRIGTPNALLRPVPPLA